MAPEHRHTVNDQGKLRGPVRAILVVDALVTGSGFAFGPPSWTSSSTLDLIRQLPLPFPVWGALFLFGGVLLASGRRLVPHFGGHGVLALLYFVWGLATLSTAFTGSLNAWGGPWHVLALAGLHFYGLYRRSRAESIARNAGR